MQIMPSDPQAASLVGCRLGVYQVVTPLGAGGMGEVYRARDTRLGRDVALKVLPRDFTADPDRLARFEREARALAALNNPHIAAIYGVEDLDAPAQSGLPGTVRALALELVEGDTLAQRIQQPERRRTGGLSVNDALAIARQIADALDSAHEKGIVHRDLKPSNIMITPDGVVKVLDFGLAKLTPGVESVEPASTSAPTLTAEGTREGLIVGTAPYMSPEQARGQTVDRRTDIWAFGCVLYEMLTGRVAFARATTTDTLAAILEREPDWNALPADVPWALRRLLDRCLQKDPRRRMRDMGDVRIGLEEVVTAPVESATQEAHPVRTRRRRSLGGALAALVAVIGAPLLIWVFGRPSDSDQAPTSARVVRLDMSLDRVGLDLPMPSPDGRHFVFVRTTGQSRLLWIHSLDSDESRSLPGTEGGVEPIWSPDGRWIAFFADGKLKKVSPSGGPPQTIAPVAGFQDGAWGARGDIIFRPSNREALLRVHESGGSPTELTKLDRSLTENSHRGPFFLPDGRRFLFTNRCEQREHNALFLGSLDSGRGQRVMPLQSNAAYVPAREGSIGALLYYRDGGLFAQQFDTERAVLLGEPIPVLERVGYIAASIRAEFEASLDGSLIVSRRTDGDDNLLTWFNRKGEATGTLGAPDSYNQPRIAPNGALVAFNRADPQNGNRDIWYTEIARGTTARLTTDGANDWFPAWSPDSKHLAFTSDRAGARSGAGGYIFIKRSMDPGLDELALSSDGESGAYDWSRDGKWISFGGRDIWVASPSGDRKPFAFLATSFREGGGRFSPDGKWIAYTSDETGRVEVYVRRFSGEPASEGRIQISKNGGEEPVWRSDGQELFYLSGNQSDVGLYAARTGDLNRAGGVPAPVLLFRACPQTAVAGYLDGTPWDYVYDTVDGDRFLINCKAHPQDRFGVLLNWTMTAGR